MPIKLPSKGGTDLPPIPADTHQAVCYGVVDLGTHTPKNPQHKDKRQVLLLFELPFERADFGEKGNLPRGISRSYGASLAPNATLKKVLESWRGKKFAPEELDSFDLKNLIGQNCNLVVSHTPSADGTKVFSNIDNIVPLRREKKDPRTGRVIEAAQEKVALENKTLYFELEGQDLVNLQFPENMPKWIQQKISFSHEFTQANGGVPDDQQQYDQQRDDPAARARHEEEARRYDERSKTGGIGATPPSAPEPQENPDEQVPF